MRSSRVFGKDPDRLNSRLYHCVVRCTHSVDPITLPGKRVRRQRYPPGLAGKQGMKIQRIPLDVKVGDRCQVLQIAGSIRCFFAFPNAVVSKLFECGLLSYSAFRNLCRVNLTRRAGFNPLLEEMDQLRLTTRDTRQAM